MLDLTVMRIYQRGGDNWGFSYGLGGVLVVGFCAVGFVAALVQYAWPMLIPVALVGVWYAARAVVEWRQRVRDTNEQMRLHDAEHIDGVADDDCHFCHLDLLWLQERERQDEAGEQERAQAQRLRTKYRNPA